MMVGESVPEELRRRIVDDLEPVRPLGAPWRRVAWIVPLVVLVVGSTFGFWGLRPDLEDLGPLLAWVPLGLQLLLGLVLVALALRQTSPDRLTSKGLLFAFVSAVLAIYLTIDLTIYLLHPRPAPDDGLATWWICFGGESLVALPILLINAALAVRALPVRPKLAGFLGGTAAGLLAEASWRLVCPVTDPAHVLPAHWGAVAGLGVVGIGLGWLWERFARWRRR